MTGTVKTCSKCGKVKPATEFHKDRQKPDGLTAGCKVCNNAATAARAEENPERARRENREATRRYYARNAVTIAAQRKAKRA